MLRSLTIFAALCAPPANCAAPDKEYIEIRAQVPPELLEPVSAPFRRLETYNGLALRVVDHREGLGRANSQIAAIGCIVRPDTATCKNQNPTSKE